MAKEDYSDKAAAADFDDQLTVGELKQELEDVPDWVGVNVMACGAVGYGRVCSFNADGFIIQE